ncbi:hypothetical protein [Pacificibacter maritimus]|uniref:hypothetical protein n=1 Tax=Pacificibacter maritimus TaxID=762213 RepID=UPI0014767D09|nr:hypothetical protein [Pacificibacter maritimus]
METFPLLFILRHPTVLICGVALTALAFNSMVYFLVREQMDPVAAMNLTDEYRHFIEIRPIWELFAANLTYVTGFLAVPFLLLRRKPAVWLFAVILVHGHLRLPKSARLTETSCA